jgi:putative intracellular protease/amidase/DNA-directed RNA polymerase subunit RPC12/RpoP
MKHHTEITDDGLTRRNFIRSSAGAVIAATLLPTIDLRAAEPRAQQAAAKNVYICPPCGQACDNLTFDKPGNCPQCGMKLIPLGGGEDSPPTVAILLFNSVEIIDFAGPWEVFGGAGYKVFSVAEKLEPVTTVYGQKITADYTFENGPKADVLLVPGGGVRGAVDNPKLIKWVQDKAKESTYVMSVCTGAFILAKAGLLDGLSATTVSGGIANLATAGTNIKVVYDKRYVDNGKIITTAGLSSGIDGSFYLVAKMLGKGAAQQTALGIEYDWDPDGKFVRAALADRYLPDARHSGVLQGTQAEMISTEGGTDHWELKILVSDPKSAAEIIDVLSNRLKSGTSHTRGPVVLSAATGNESASSSQIKWTFTDDQGRGWRGLAVAEPSPASKGKFILSLKLARAGQ